MDDREETRCHYREHRHRLSQSVNRLTEVSSEEVKNRRDKSSRVRDTYPEYEVGNVGTPPDRVALTGLSEAAPHLVEPAGGSDRQEEETGEEKKKPTRSRGLHHTQNRVINLSVGYWRLML
jgi:hypothetical protein